MKAFLSVIIACVIISFVIWSCRETETLFLVKADFAFDAENVKTGDTIYFVNLSENATSFLWDFGDGVQSVQFEPFHAYDIDDIYTIRLVAIGESKSDTATRMLSIADSRTLRFVSNKGVATIGEAVSFTNLSEGYDTYQWDFGDDKQSEAVHPKYAYTNEKDFTIRLTGKVGSTIEKYVESNIKVLTPNNRWAYLLNHNKESIDSVYAQNGFILTADGELYKGKTQIKQYYNEHNLHFANVSAITLLKEHQDRHNNAYKYEIGSFNSHSGEYRHLIIWKKEYNVNMRLFEIVCKRNDQFTDVEFLEQRRKDWVNGSNSHDVSSFINDLYTADGVYYNGGTRNFFVGREQIIGTYQYMAGSNWSINSLTAVSCIRVNESVAFEIGIYSGPWGVGEYVIVWRKDADHVWRILFDSNY